MNRRMFLVLCVALLAPAGARAQDAASRAQTLFEEGVALRAAGRLNEACAKFEESGRLDPASGTRFHLADCYERIGWLASAWTLFRDVAATTEAAGETERAEAARRRVARLEPRLSKVTIVVTEPLEQMVITHNRTSVARTEWGTAIPVDRGRHRIEATAPGRRAWSTEITVKADAESVTVQVPALLGTAQPLPTPSPEPTIVPEPPALEQPSEGGPPTMVVAGIVTGAIGLGGVIVGAAFGGVAISKKHEAEELCPDYPNSCPTDDGIKVNDEAKRAGIVSTVAITIGAALVVTGVVLWIVGATKSDTNAARNVIRF